MSFPVFLIVAAVISGATVVGTWRLREQPLYALVVVAIGGTALLLLHGRYFDYYADDAFITLRYSRNLADGLGPVWNRGERVEGYTTFLWMLMHAGFAKAGLNLVSVSLALSLVSLIATTLLVIGLWRVLASEEPAKTKLRSPVVPAVAVLALGLIDGVAFWGFSGMETPLTMTLITASVYLYLLERRGQAPFYTSAVVLAAAAMTRPEALVLVPVTGVFKLWAAIASEHRARDLRRVAMWGALFAGLYGAYFLWRYNYYGEFFPNTYYAKVEGTLNVLRRGSDYVRSNGLNYQMLPLLIGLGILAANRRTRMDGAYLLALVGAWFAAVAYEGGDAFPHGRFIVPVLPLLFLGGLYGLTILLEWVTRSNSRRLAWLAPALVLGCLVLAATPWDDGVSPLLRGERRIPQERRELGLWLKHTVPADYTVGVYAAGAVSYYSELPTLDLFGLNDAIIAHTAVDDFGLGIPGHERYNLDYVLEVARPNIIVMTDAGPVLPNRESWERSPPGPIAGINFLIHDPRLWEQYEAVSIGYKDDTWFNFLVRRDSLGPFRQR
jgi:hypothetical protein